MIVFGVCAIEVQIPHVDTILGTTPIVAVVTKVDERTISNPKHTLFVAINLMQRSVVLFF
jgi:hypothetical protein